VRRGCDGFSAHPIERVVGSVGSDDLFPSRTVGQLLALHSSLVAYSIMALSKSVSYSSAGLCFPQSKCLTSDECRVNVLAHPSSGHVNNRHLLAASTSTVDSSDDSSTQSELPSTSVTGVRPSVRLGFTGIKSRWSRV